MRCRLPLPLPCLLALACGPASVIVPSSALAPEPSLAPPPPPSPVPPEPAPDPGPSRVESSLVEEPLRLEVELVRGEVIWDGDGGYANSFGYCETVDVPEPRAEGEVLIIDRWTGTFRHDDMEPLGDPCMPVPEQRVEEARLGL